MSRELKLYADTEQSLLREQRGVERSLKRNKAELHAWIEERVGKELIFVDTASKERYMLLALEESMNSVFVKNMQTGENENWLPITFAANLQLESEIEAEELEAKEQATRIFYTDGGCNPNPGKGAWVYVETKKDRVCAVKTAFKKKSTNNEMEATAALMVLRDLAPGSRARITTDSQYVVNAISKWRKGWFVYADGTVFLKKKDLKNAEIFEEIHLLIESQKLEIEMVWVKGHNGNKYNEFCDGICTESIEKEKSLTISVQQTLEEKKEQLAKDMGWKKSDGN